MLFKHHHCDCVLFSKRCGSATAQHTPLVLPGAKLSPAMHATHAEAHGCTRPRVTRPGTQTLLRLARNPRARPAARRSLGGTGARDGCDVCTHRREAAGPHACAPLRADTQGDHGA